VREGSKWPGYVRTAVEQMRQQGDASIDTIVFPWNGFGGHPRVKQHQTNAAQLTAFIRQKMGW